MARQVRVEFPGAIYHAMARGDRREPIVIDDADRERFSRMLEELVKQTGWEMFAWVLMDNHYHLVFKTPEPNLVAGMKWLQNTWTKRFNARHGLWGHVFGGRYKAVLVEENEHLAILLDYVHLNPFRAGMVSLQKGLESYRWSSLDDYVKPPRKRSGWVQVERGFEQKELGPDKAATRRRYLEHLEAIARQKKGLPELPDVDGRTLQSTLRRGWYLGSEEFREKMVERLSKIKGQEKKHDAASGYTGAQARDHGEAMGERIVKEGLRCCELGKRDLAKLKKGDWRKRAIGRVVRRHTTLPAGWIAKRLLMGHPVRAAALTATDPSAEWGEEWKNAQRLVKELAEILENLD